MTALERARLIARFNNPGWRELLAEYQAKGFESDEAAIEATFIWFDQEIRPHFLELAEKYDKAVETLKKIENNPTSDSYGQSNKRNTWTDWAKAKAKETLKELGELD